MRVFVRKQFRSDKILGSPGTSATEDIVSKVVKLYQDNNIELPTELNSRQLGDFGKLKQH